MNHSFLPIKLIPISKLFVDYSYQRLQDSNHVLGIVANFDPHVFQVLEVAERDGDKYAVIDGAHKLAAARILGFEELYCRVHAGLTVQDEAMYFNMFQTERKSLTPIEMFNADVVRGYEPAIRIKSIIESEGFRLDSRPNGGSLTFVKALYHADKLGLLRQQLKLIREAWGIRTGENAVKSQTFFKVTKFLASIAGTIDETAVRAILGRNQYDGCPSTATHASLMQDYISASMSEAA